MSMLLIIGTPEDVKRLIAEQEKAELEVIRARARVESIEDADKRMDCVNLALDTALQMLNDAYINFDEDEPLDFETALDRSRRLESIEREYDRIARAWKAHRTRVGYVAREAAKA